MRITGVLNFTFNGIRVMQDDSKEKKTSQRLVYEDMSQRLSAAQELSDSLQIRTVSSAREEVYDQMERKKKAKEAEIEKQYSKFYNFFLTKRKERKKGAALAEIEREKQVLLNSIKADPNLELKVKIIDQMIDILDDGLGKINNMDSNLSKMQIAKHNTETSDGIVQNAEAAKGFSNVAGYEYEKLILLDKFVDIVQSEKAGEDVDVPGSVLFFGPWNNGKTHMVKNIAAQTGCKILRPKKHKGMNAKSYMEELFVQAKEAKERYDKTGVRTIILIDEADKIFNKISAPNTEFEDFLKTCSDEYHCSIFVTTNNPSHLCMDFDDPKIFPIRMSIDIPDEDNLKAVLKHYTKGALADDADYNAIMQALMDKIENTGGKYSNGQIVHIINNMFIKLGSQKVSQDDIIRYINESNIEPDLTSEQIEEFEEEYNAIMGDE